MMQASPDSTDVFIIGGGPAGLAAAIAARQRGFRVMVADGDEPPIDKACGEGLMPDGLAALRELGIAIPAEEAFSFRGIRFLNTTLSAEAVFPNGGRGIAIRRTALHWAMVKFAEALGVNLLWRSAVTGISQDAVQLGSRRILARWIIGADGARSRVRRWAKLDAGWRSKFRYAFRQHYEAAPWTDHVEVHWGNRCQGYATAVNREQVCVAVASHDPVLRVAQALPGLPQLCARLKGAKPIGSEKGAVTGNYTLRRVWRGNVALIGDASGTVDAITGEGIGLAFRQAKVLAECLETADLARYQASHRGLCRRPRSMARLMLTLDERPALQRRTLQMFRQHPEIFRRMLAFHIGELPPVHWAWAGFTLGWGLLTA